MGHKKVCFNCRKAFNQNSDFTKRSNDGLICPECGETLLEVNHKFRPPRKSDKEGWDVAHFLVSKGFPYQHIYKYTQQAYGPALQEYVKYPTKMRDAILFVKDFKSQAIK